MLGVGQTGAWIAPPCADMGALELYICVSTPVVAPAPAPSSTKAASMHPHDCCWSVLEAPFCGTFTTRVVAASCLAAAAAQVDLLKDMCASRGALELHQWLRPLLFLAADAAAHAQWLQAAQALDAVVAGLRHMPRPQVRKKCLKPKSKTNEQINTNAQGEIQAGRALREKAHEHS